MQKLKLNKDYELDHEKEYVINLNDEMKEQQGILSAVQMMGLDALKDYNDWLSKNGFDVNMPNPTNEFVSTYYGVKPLWNTELSKGIVVKEENDDDYFIVMECSRLNKGFKHTQIILTLGGCL